LWISYFIFLAIDQSQRIELKGGFSKHFQHNVTKEANNKFINVLGKGKPLEELENRQHIHKKY
jgi:hypothetical protein